MTVCILGLGYVGLTLAVTLANSKISVYGIDVDKNKIKKLSMGEPPLFEPGLKTILNETIKNNFLKFGDCLTKEIAEDVNSYIICIGTPLDNSSKKPIFSHLEVVINSIIEFLKKGDTIISRSTVTVGTVRNMIKNPIEQKTTFKVGNEVFLACAPERTVEGNALNELKELPQIIGADDSESLDKASNIFNKLTKTILRMNSYEAAEVIKLLDNTSRDVNIAMANQFGLILEKLGLNSNQIIEAANYDYKRNKIFKAGAGVGGPCLVKDPYFLLESVKDKVNIPLIKIAREINDSMPHHVFELIQDVFSSMSRSITGSKIFILGFAFKGTPATDDTRFSPSIKVIEILKKNGAELLGYDPVVDSKIIEEFGVKYSPLTNVADIDCIVIMNNNKKYLEMNLEKIKNNSKKPIGFVDGWELFDVNFVKKLGFIYRGVGIG